MVGVTRLLVAKYQRDHFSSQASLMGLVLLTAGPRRSRGASGPPPPVRKGPGDIGWRGNHLGNEFDNLR